MLLEAIKLSKSFGQVTALESLDLAIDAGEALCLLGANGAGKSTTINLFLGFLRPSSGTARVKGVSVADDPLAARAHLAYVPERVSLYPQLSGIENLSYFLSLGRSEVPERNALIELLAEVGLSKEAAARRAASYSKGMRQRVALALALARRADALLLDEPTSGLDPAAIRELGTLLSRIRDRGTAILMVTHDLGIARDIANRVGIMRRGRLINLVSPADMTPGDLEQLY